MSDDFACIFVVSSSLSFYFGVMFLYDGYSLPVVGKFVSSMELPFVETRSFQGYFGILVENIFGFLIN